MPPSPEPLLPALRWDYRLVVYQVADEETGEAVREAAADHEDAFADRRILFLALDPGGAVPGDPPPRHHSLTPAREREVRERWAIAGEGTVFLLVGLDGTVKDRRESVPRWEEWWDRIDRMPMRRRELREREDA
jgi:hypothetical protein